MVSDPIRKMYKGMNLGDKISLRGNEWTIVGVFAGVNSLSDSAVRADAETVMSAFGRTTFQQVNLQLESPADIPRFKDAVTANPAISVDVKTLAQNFNDGFGPAQSTARLRGVLRRQRDGERRHLRCAE